MSFRKISILDFPSCDVRGKLEYEGAERRSNINGAQIAGMRMHNQLNMLIIHIVLIMNRNQSPFANTTSKAKPSHMAQPAGGQRDQSGLDTFLRPSRCCKGEHGGAQLLVSRAQATCCSIVSFAACGGVGGWGLFRYVLLALLLFRLRASRFPV